MTSVIDHMKSMQQIINSTQEVPYFFYLLKRLARVPFAAIFGRSDGRNVKPNTFLNTAKAGDSPNMLFEPEITPSKIGKFFIFNF